MAVFKSHFNRALGKYYSSETDYKNDLKKYGFQPESKYKKTVKKEEKVIKDETRILINQVISTRENKSRFSDRMIEANINRGLGYNKETGHFFDPRGQQARERGMNFDPNSIIKMKVRK